MRVFERGAERFEIELDSSSIVARSYVRGALVDTETHARATLLLAKWDSDRMCAAKLADGFQRVDGDDYLELGDRDFESALVADPDDSDTYVVYGDWLAERGDAWGQLILVQHAIATLPRFGAGARRDELEREEALLLFQNAARLWGWLGETIVNENTQTYACDLLHPAWHRGFVRSVDLCNLGDEGPASFVALVSELARLPITSLLRRIAVTDDELSPRRLEALATQTWPCLAELELRSEFAFRDGELFDSAPLAPLFDGRAPRLESLLVIGGTNLEPLCRAIASGPGARRLGSISIERCHWSEPAVAALAAGSLSRLEHLSISGTGIPADARERLAPIAAKLRVDIRTEPEYDDFFE